MTTIPGTPVTGPGVLGGGIHGATLPGPGAACSGELVRPGGTEAALLGVWPLTGTPTEDGSSSRGASVGAHARFGDAPKAATATAATMIHAADAATPTGVASGAPRSAPGVRIPLSIDAAPDVRVGRARPAARGVSARRSAYGSAARLTSPRAGPGAVTIGRWPGASTSRNGAHFRQAPSMRFQQSAQQAAPQIGQSR